MDSRGQTKTYYEGTVAPIYRVISGTSLHLGMYESEADTRESAIARTKAFLAARVQAGPGSTLVDLGSGYGESGRYLAQRFGCRVVGINLIHGQNVRARELNGQAGLEARVGVASGDFGAAPLASACADLVWSQEALLHAPDRRRVLAECARLLRPDGTLLLTDVLQTGPMEPEEARLIFERVKVNSLETWEGYHGHLAATGLRLIESADLSRYLAGSYANLVNAIRRHYAGLVADVGAGAVDYTLAAFERWVRAGEDGQLGWAMFVAQKF